MILEEQGSFFVRQLWSHQLDGVQFHNHIFIVHPEN